MLSIGMKGKITGFSKEKLSGRLLELGIIPGKTLEVIRKAPFKGAYYVKVNSHPFVLRKEELEAIETESSRDQ